MMCGISKKKTVRRLFFFAVLFARASAGITNAESLSMTGADILEIAADRPNGMSTLISSGESALVVLEKDTRFFSGVEFEITAPAAWISHHGALAVAFYSSLDRLPEGYTGNIQVKELRFEPLPNKIQNIYQIPVRQGHGLRSTPYVSILREPVMPDEFPVLFRIVPMGTAHDDEAGAMEFRLTVKPVFSDEGAVRVYLRYPEHLQDKPVAVLIDGKVIENPAQERLLKEGEHQITALSADYRNQNRRFMVERGKPLLITLTLQDLTPQMIFETPANAHIFLDEKPVHSTTHPLAVEAGKHDVKIQVSDYSIIRSINVQKGKTYRITFTIDMAISEHE
ncbi:MAG: PEGA domain-containing protein [Spirochaetaceae bacterium]|jgi:hypothetical protein|nr:PEGA domain-containing protein [Spirochaetaceae bacterium]